MKGATNVIKPNCNILGTDGNVYALIGRVSKSLEDAGLKDQDKEFVSRAVSAGSYDEVLVLIQDYVDIEIEDSNEL